MAVLSFFCFLFLISLSSLSTSSPPPPPTTTTTIPLSHFHPIKFPDPFQKFAHLATQPITRAHHLKNPQTTPSATTTTTATPLSSHSYGAYSIPLRFGTPPQTLQFIMDTGSDIVWFPCTHRYQCKNCSFTGQNPTQFPPFVPKSSLSVKILGCLNPKCGWIHHTNLTRCANCEPRSRNCSQICPPYLILYGSGATGGFGLVDTLDLPEKKVPNFVVGCSVFSSNQPAGIAGFGRGRPSLPTQLGLKKFSYCLLSRKFDETDETTALVLDTGFNSGHKTDGVSYTPFVKNPTVPGKEAFSVYYYVNLRKITVDGKNVRIPYEYLSAGHDGNGGTIVDSGTTFTYMSNAVFEPVLTQLVTQVKNYRRASEVELGTGLRPCFNVSGADTVVLPELKLHFKGGTEMPLPLENYFVVVGKTGAVCLAMVTDGVSSPASSGGPAIILGNFQMQNIYVEYDLRNERLGFRQQLCK
ncbi:Aspartic endopeptidase [Sarracenia purpurea var. burkii]